MDAATCSPAQMAVLAEQRGKGKAKITYYRDALAGRACG
jgi:hypothetical protein